MGSESVPDWTEEQAAAIAARAPRVVCAAAAGSGKTAVLTARVVGLLADPQAPAALADLLIVTFTRAAAAEMRQRIGSSLREHAERGDDPGGRLRREAALLPQAEIGTIHAFCDRLLRRSFAAAGLDPEYRILDPAEAAGLLEECLTEEMDARYAGRHPDAAAFAETVERYGGARLDEDLRRLALRLHHAAASMEDPEAWLRGRLAGAAAPDLDAARRAARRALGQALGLVGRAAALAEGPGGPAAYAPALAADAEMLERLRAAAEGPWDGMAEALGTAAFGRLAALGTDADRLTAERARALRDRAKRLLGALQQGPCGRREDEHRTEAARVAGHLAPLLALVRDLGTAYGVAKRQRNAVDFEDLEHRSLELLRGPLGPELCRYREVLVDEAQDLSPVQDALLSALCGPARLFCVGDARQSIYGFRLADPRRFLDRAADPAPGLAGGAAQVVRLPHNFRSRAAVLSGVNLVFGALFAARGSDLPPSEADPLLARTAFPGPDHPLELHLLEGEDDDGLSTGLEREAAAVARIVAGWLRGTVTERGQSRPARPGDAAVLLRAAAGREHAYADALRRAGLPCAVPGARADAATAEGRAVLAWLGVLDNPQQDIPLAAVLRGPFGGFGDADLARWRVEARPGASLWDCLRGAARREAAAAAWLRRLEAWRTEARRGAFGPLLEGALEDGGHAAAAAGLPDGPRRVATLEGLVRRFRDAGAQPGMDAARLAVLLQHAEPAATAAESAAAAGDAVRVLTVHGCKGLEFPLVVVAGLGRTFSNRDRLGDVLVHRDAGLGARAVDPERRTKWPTLAHAAVGERLEAEGRAEEARILYVALTRARERLALVGRTRGLEEHVAEWREVAHLPPDLGDGGCALDWLGPVLARHPDVDAAFAAPSGAAPRGGDGGGHRWVVTLEVGAAAEAVAEAAPAAAPEAAGGEGDAALGARLESERAFRYPALPATAVPAKVAAAEAAASLAAASGPQEEAAAAWDAVTPAVPRRPRLGARRAVTPAEAGSATHLLLRHLDLAGPCDAEAVEACRRKLQEQELAEPNAAAAVDGAAVARFLDGPLGRRLRRAAAAGALLREVPFALRLPAAGIPGAARGPALDGEWVLVQGVIDALAVAPGDLLLVDYKTGDPAPDDGALARYAEQVRMYAEAVRGAFGEPPREAWLAFLDLGRTVPVPLRGPEA